MGIWRGPVWSVCLSSVEGSWTHIQARPGQRCGIQSPVRLAWDCVGKRVAPEEVGEAVWKPRQLIRRGGGGDSPCPWPSAWPSSATAPVPRSGDSGLPASSSSWNFTPTRTPGPSSDYMQMSLPPESHPASPQIVPTAPRTPLTHSEFCHFISFRSPLPLDAVPGPAQD